MEEMVRLYFLGLAGETELLNHLEKLKRQDAAINKTNEVGEDLLLESRIEPFNGLEFHNLPSSRRSTSRSRSPAVPQLHGSVRYSVGGVNTIAARCGDDG
jgi:hypothetical protein